MNCCLAACETSFYEVKSTVFTDDGGLAEAESGCWGVAIPTGDFSGDNAAADSDDADCYAIGHVAEVAKLSSVYFGHVGERGERALDEFEVVDLDLHGVLSFLGRCVVVYLIQLLLMIEVGSHKHDYHLAHTLFVMVVNFKIGQHLFRDVTKLITSQAFLDNSVTEKSSATTEKSSLVA